MELLAWAAFFLFCLLCGPIGWGLFVLVLFCSSLEGFRTDCRLRWQHFRQWNEAGRPLTLPILFCTALTIGVVALIFWCDQNPAGPSAAMVPFQ